MKQCFIHLKCFTVYVSCRYAFINKIFKYIIIAKYYCVLLKDALLLNIF